MPSHTNPIPPYLQSYVTEAIESGLRDPEEILDAAVRQCNKTSNEIIEGKSQRARIVRNSLASEVWVSVRLS